MEKASFCSSCQERTHSARKCPLLWEMLKEEFYKGSGKGGGDEEDDSLSILNSYILEPNYDNRQKAFKNTLKINYNDIFGKNSY